MQRTQILALLMVSLFFGAGCLNAIDGEVEVPNVVLPEDWATITARSVANPHLVGFEDCNELEQRLKQSIQEEYRTQLLQAVAEEYYYGSGGMWMDDAEMAMDSTSAADGGSATPRTTPTRVEGEDYSGTNNQEAGVDEADFVKTDGYNIYYLQDQTLYIFGVPEFGSLTDLSNMTIEGSPVAMMLDGDQLVVISVLNPWSLASESPMRDAMEWDDDYGTWRTTSLTKFTVIDVTNRSLPDVERELYIEGNYITAREVNGTVRTVTHAWMDVSGLQSWLNLPSGYWNLGTDDPLRVEIREKLAYEAMISNAETLALLSLEDLVPQVYEYADGQVITHSMTDEACSDFVAPEDGMNRGISSIFMLELTSEQFSFEVDHVVGTYPQVYASTDILVLAESAFDWWWFWGNDDGYEMTNLHTFDISASDATLYTGSGRVNGTVVNQFALSEYEGVLRVATTTGQWARWWMEAPEPMSSQLVTLERSMDLTTERQTLVEVGRVDGIAPGERIWSARFDGDRAYIVTFEQIDPLWVIDVSDETNPTILGELKVPGVSTYIHPLSRDHLLTIGLGPANEDGTGLDWSGTQLSLFDISDPTVPQQADTLRISPVNYDDRHSWSWSWSEATYESKAFQYWAPKNMLAVPLSTYRYVDTYEGGSYSWSYQYISKLVLVSVNESDGTLTVYGEVNHSSLYDREDNDRYWWNDQSIRRSIFMGDYVYAISSAGVTATNLTTLEETARVTLPQYAMSYAMDTTETDSEVETATDRESEPERESESDAEREPDGDGEEATEDRG